MPENNCPNNHSLHQFLDGYIDGPQAAVMERHLATCSHCAGQAEQANVSDRLVLALREGKSLDEESSFIGPLIERFKSMQADSVRLSEDDTNSGKVPRSPGAVTRGAAARADSAASIALSFLDPPENDGEIGRLGRYHVLEFLGAGGMGIVLRAEDTQLKRMVAIKVLNVQRVGSDDAKARFLREAQATAAIDHDHVVTIHDVDERNGMPFYAMQFLRGKPLNKYIQEREKLSESETLRIGREIAEGLSAIHGQGLTHRDIKPENIWLEADTNRVKIVDFGLAQVGDQFGDSNLTQTGAILGTPRYMAPEQAQGLEVDHRGDLFSLGSVMYHLASGRPPFRGKNVIATISAVIDQQPDRLDELNADVTGELVAFISKLMEKDPQQRVQTADEAVEAIRQIETQSGMTKRGTEVEVASQPRLRPKGLSRQRWWVAATLASVVLLVVVLAATINVKTPHGTLVIEANDKVSVVVEKQKVKIRHRDSGETYTLSVGENKLQSGDYEILVEQQKSGLRFSTKQFTIARGDRTELSVRLLPPRIPVQPADVSSPSSSPLIRSWPQPGGKADYASFATGQWKKVHLNDELIEKWRRDSNFKKQIVRQNDGTLMIDGPSAGGISIPGYDGKNVIFRIRVNQKLIDRNNFVGLGVRESKNTYYTAGLYSTHMVNMGLIANGRFIGLTHKSFDKPYSGECEFTLAAIGPQITAYINGKRVTTVTQEVHTFGTLVLKSHGPVHVKDMEIMILDEDSAPIPNAKKWSRPAKTPGYADLIEGRTWQKFALDDKFFETWKTKREPNKQFRHTDDGGLKIVGPSVGGIYLPGLISRDHIVRGLVKIAGANKSDFVTFGVRSRSSLRVAAAFHPSESLRFGISSRRWYQVTHRTFEEPFNDECELAMAAKGDLTRVFLNGHEVFTITTDDFTAGSVYLQTQGTVTIRDLEVINLDEPRKETTKNQ